MNTTNSTGLPEFDFQSFFAVPQWVRIMELAYLVTIMLLGIPGNGLIILVQWKNQERSSTDYLVVNMAVFEFLCSSINAPIYICQNTQTLWRYFASTSACKTFVFSSYLTGVSSTLLLTAIAIDRYIKTCRPLNSFYTTNRAKYLCIGISVTSVLLASPALFVFYLHDGGFCFAYESFSRLLGVWNAVLVSMTIAVFFTVSLLYLKVTISLRRRHKERIRARLAVAERTETTHVTEQRSNKVAPLPSPSNVTNVGNKSRQGNELARTHATYGKDTHIFIVSSPTTSVSDKGFYDGANSVRGYDATDTTCNNDASNTVRDYDATNCARVYDVTAANTTHKNIDNTIGNDAANATRVNDAVESSRRRNTTATSLGNYDAYHGSSHSEQEISTSICDQLPITVVRSLSIEKKRKQASKQSDSNKHTHSTSNNKHVPGELTSNAKSRLTLTDTRMSNVVQSVMDIQRQRRGLIKGLVSQEQVMNRTTRIMLLIALIYMVTHGSNWLILFSGGRSQFSHIARYLSLSIIMINCITNPLCFFCMSSRFRAKAKRIICRCHQAITV